VVVASVVVVVIAVVVVAAVVVVVVVVVAGAQSKPISMQQSSTDAYVHDSTFIGNTIHGSGLESHRQDRSYM